MSKELYMTAYELLEVDLGREPTEEEVMEKMEFMMADGYDRAKDIRKYGE